jgi:DNA-binding protein HU-beta
VPKTVTKGDLVDEVAMKVNLTKVQAGEAIDAVIEGVMNALSAGDKVQLTGFGTFEVRQRKERVGRNPTDPAKTIIIPAQKAPVFKAGKRLKDAVR